VRILVSTKSVFVLPALLWWVALYPGRLGYDYALLARIIREGEQTSWWGATFFWLFKFTTFDGRYLGIISLISLLSLAHAIHYFISSIVTRDDSRNKLTLLFLFTPFFGVFGANVSHDVFQTAGVILLTSTLIRLRKQNSQGYSPTLQLCLSSAYLTTTQYGLSIFLIVVIFLVRRYLFSSVLSICLGISLYAIANLAVVAESDMTIRKEFYLRNMILIDLKCIAQHDEAEISDGEWAYLETYAPIESWKEKISCASPDGLAFPLALEENSRPLELSLIKTAFNIAIRQPAIPLMSHIQRSRVALPPPFFQAPDNQVELDVTKPIGINTNTALQSGPGLLHPSIDDEILARRPAVLRPLEMFVLMPAFLINQASWFWSWGGLWLYPMFFLILGLLRKNIQSVLIVFVPTLLLHFVIFIVGPSSIGRYVMSTIIMGLVSTLVLLNRLVKRIA